MRSCTSCARAAAYSSASVRAPMASEASLTSARMRSEASTPPGSRSASTALPRLASSAARACASVDLPAPSRPSIVISLPRLTGQTLRWPPMALADLPAAIEDVDTLNDQAANRMLKTLEEPPAFVHLLLLTTRPGEVMPTIASRCQLVRFDPLAPDRIAADLIAGGDPGGLDDLHARACARLALGDASRAALLASEEGEALRESAEAFVRLSISGETGERPWTRLPAPA